MDVYWYIIFFIFGAIIGSFLNVVLYRLHTGKSLEGRSHCLSCGKNLEWFELLPIISYLALRAKCKKCESHIPSHYFIVELLTGALFAFMWHVHASDFVLLGLYLLLVTLLVGVCVYDLRHMIVPNEFVVLMLAVAILIVSYVTFREVHLGLPFLIDSAAAGAGAFLFFAGIWFLSRGRGMGLGDAKLALPLGIILGSWGMFFTVVISFWIGALVMLFLLALEHFFRAGKTRLQYFRAPLTMKSEVPFAPFLILGFFLVHFFHVDLYVVSFLWSL